MPNNAHIQPWFRIDARGHTTPADIYIYGDIGEDWWAEESITAKSFVDKLQGLGKRPINVRINSYGGSVADGLAIYNAMRRHPGEVVAYNDGVAVSIASLILMGADRRVMAENALVMIHPPWGAAAGNATVMRQMADVLDQYAGAMASAYQGATGKSRDEVMAWLTGDVEFWFDSSEALDEGLVTEISQPLQIAAALLPERFTPPRGFPMEPKNISSTPSAAAKAAALAEEKSRRSDIRARLTLFLHLDGCQALLDNALDDPSAEPGTVCAKLSDLMAAWNKKHDMGPIAGAGGFAPGRDETDIQSPLAMEQGLFARLSGRYQGLSPAARTWARASVADFAEACLRSAGKSTRFHGRDAVLAAAMTTSDFVHLLGDTASKVLLAAYAEVPDTFRSWTSERQVNDFRPINLVNLSESPALLEVEEHADYLHGHLLDGAESAQVKTHGRILALTRQALINDDLGGFARAIAGFAASARRLEADLVYGKLTANPTLSDGHALFSTEHGNLASAPAAISVESLGAARAAMRKQRGLLGQAFVDPQPRVLLTPVSLQTLAETTIASTVIPGTTNSQENAAWVRNLIVVADPRLDEDSDSAWYLVADPLSLESVVRLYLGSSIGGPELIEMDDFDRDVTKYKCRLDVGAGVCDFRGLFKVPGA